MDREQLKKYLEQTAVHLSTHNPWVVEEKENDDRFFLVSKPRHCNENDFCMTLACDIIAGMITATIHLQDELKPFEMTEDEKASLYIDYRPYIVRYSDVDAFDFAKSIIENYLPSAKIVFDFALERYLKDKDKEQTLKTAIESLREVCGDQIEISSTGDIFSHPNDESWYLKQSGVDYYTVDLQIFNLSVARARLVLEALLKPLDKL